MPRQILLVDDSLTIHRVVEMTFAREDYVLTTAKSMDEGLTRARELRPDIVLADVGLPGKSGYDLCSALRADGELGETACLLLTGNFSPYDEQKGAACGADGWVVKPFETQVIVDKVADAIAKRGGRPTAAIAPSPTPTAEVPSTQAPAEALIPPAPAPAPTLTGSAPRSINPRQTMIGVAPLTPPLPMRDPEAVRSPSAPRPVPSTVSRIPVSAPPPVIAAPPPFTPPLVIAALPPPVPPPVIAAPPPPVPPPVVAAPRPSTLDYRPSTLDPRPSTLDYRPSTIDPPINALPTNVPQMPRPSMIPHVPTPSPQVAAPAQAPSRPTSRATLMGIPAISGNLVPSPTSLAPKPAGPWAPPVQKAEVTSPHTVSSLAPAAREGGAQAAPSRDNLTHLMTAVTERATTAVASAASARGADYEAIAQLSKEVIEQIVWEVVPELAETMIKEQLDRLVRERQSL